MKIHIGAETFSRNPYNSLQSKGSALNNQKLFLTESDIKIIKNNTSQDKNKLDLINEDN